MGMTTRASIDIDAPREEVFRWITEYDKLTTWMGSAGAMPQDYSQLKVGFTAQGTMPVPGGERTNTLLVTAWDPPGTFACTITYAGGDSLSTYTLTDNGHGTHLELTGDTDWADTDESAVGKAMEGQSAEAKQAIAAAMQQMEGMLDQGAFDAGTQVYLQKAVEDSLATLKGLIEAG